MKSRQAQLQCFSRGAFGRNHKAETLFFMLLSNRSHFKGRERSRARVMCMAIKSTVSSPSFGGSSSKEENLHRGVFRAGAATPDNCQTIAAARDPKFHEPPKLEFQGKCGSQGDCRPRPDKAVMEKAGEFFSALISEGYVQNRCG